MVIRESAPKTRPIRVLIGNSQDVISDTVSSVIDHAFESQFEVCSVQIGSPKQLLAWANAQEYDLFVIVLNNLLIMKDSRLHDALDMLSSLKAQYDKPVIAMSGYLDDEPQLGAKAMRAGADAFFFLPFDVPEFVAVVRKLLGLSGSRI